MSDTMPTARRALLVAGAASLAMPRLRPARAASPFRLATNWYAQPDQGGFYQAQATGLYRKAGIEVAIQSGSPQLNVSQLLLAGAVDAIIGYDTEVLTQVARGLPVVTVAALFQYDQEGMLVHEDVERIEQLRDRTLMIATNSQGGFWPWLKQRFGFTDEQTRTYTDNLQPFLLDPRVAIQAIATAEPCQLRKRGVGFRFMPFRDYGYPSYSCTVVTRRDVLERDPARLRAFLQASFEGYRDYLGGDPGPANAIIRRENPILKPDDIDCAIRTIRASAACTGGDAARGGIGVMTEARWRTTYEFMVRYKLLPAGADWQRAFSLDALPAHPVLP